MTFSAISTTLPVIVRITTRGVNSVKIDTSRFSTTGATGASGRLPLGATCRSISRSCASASASRPFDSSQRGDLGMLRRRNQTISAPTPTMTNIQRQPKFGITKRPIRAERNSAELVMTASPVPQRPRLPGGTNSLIVT